MLIFSIRFTFHYPTLTRLVITLSIKILVEAPQPVYDPNILHLVSKSSGYSPKVLRKVIFSLELEVKLIELNKVKNSQIFLAANPKQIQKLKVKNQNDNSRPKNVVRGFSLVPRCDCTTLKGRTTIVSRT